MIRAIANHFRGFWRDLRSWVDAQDGKRATPHVTFLRSKDGSVPFARLPSGQIISLKRAQKCAAARPPDRFPE